ncbi:CheR family methyltransferase [Lysobacter sp. HA18]
MSAVMERTTTDAGWSAAPAPSITDAEFARLRDWLHDATGIHLTAAKKTLVTSRLARRLREAGDATFSAYLSRVFDDSAERQVAIDLLTTNETYFFREAAHFDFLASRVAQLPAERTVRVWSAASSSGEEAYSIAMLLDSKLGMRPWEVVGTDISARMVQAARAGHYRLQRTSGIPRPMLERYCLKGTGSQAGTLLVNRRLRERVRFEHANLTSSLPELGEFDVIFLRNVMIYFDNATKRGVVERVLRHLRPGGHLLVGHSETLGDVTQAVRALSPSIYVRA